MPKHLSAEMEFRRLKNSSTNIREVARIAGVGVATVSRVINGSELVSPRMREHVDAVIRQLRYRPHALARRILGHSQLICFVLANRPFLHPFHAGILQGVDNCARELQRHVVFLGVECAPVTHPREIVLPPVLEEKGWVEGVILTGAVFPNLVSRLNALDLPLVIFGNNAFDGRWSNDVCQVRYDGAKAEFAAAEYLINRGHRSIAYVGDARFPWFREQRRGYLQALRQHKLTPLPFARKGPEDNVEYGTWAAETLIKSGQVPTAILAGNDEIGFGLYRSLRALNLHIPRDISIIGFDDGQIAAIMDPPLTTVRVPSQEIGCCCVRLLLQKLYDGFTADDIQFVGTEIIERRSVRSVRVRAD